MPFSRAILNPSNVDPGELAGKETCGKGKSTNLHSPIAEQGDRASLPFEVPQTGSVPDSARYR
jgi:hypothetical protein